MEKFLSIPVAGSGDVLLNVNEVLSVTAATSTNLDTVITYLNGNTATVTTSAAQVDYSMRKAIQDAMVAALQTSWTRVTYDVVPPQAVSGIVIA